MDEQTEIILKRTENDIEQTETVLYTYENSSAFTKKRAIISSFFNINYFAIGCKRLINFNDFPVPITTDSNGLDAK